MRETTIQIEPSDKYWRVVDPVERVHGDDTNFEGWPDDHKNAADAYLETVDGTSSGEILTDCSCGPNGACHKCDSDYDPLTWGDIGVSSDSDIVAKMATYFDGMFPDESTGRLRAKLRLLDVEVYANAQIAAQAELRD